MALNAFFADTSESSPIGTASRDGGLMGSAGSDWADEMDNLPTARKSRSDLYLHIRLTISRT